MLAEYNSLHERCYMCYESLDNFIFFFFCHWITPDDNALKVKKHRESK